jgi:hypothetical protein
MKTPAKLDLGKDDFDRIDKVQSVHDVLSLVFDVDALIEHDPPVHRIMSNHGTSVGQGGTSHRFRCSDLASFPVEGNINAVAEMEKIQGHTCSNASGRERFVSQSLGPKAMFSDLELIAFWAN